MTVNRVYHSYVLMNVQEPQLQEKCAPSEYLLSIYISPNFVRIDFVFWFTAWCWGKSDQVWLFRKILIGWHLNKVLVIFVLWQFCHYFGYGIVLFCYTWSFSFMRKLHALDLIVEFLTTSTVWMICCVYVQGTLPYNISDGARLFEK